MPTSDAETMALHLEDYSATLSSMALKQPINDLISAVFWHAVVLRLGELDRKATVPLNSIGGTSSVF